MEGGHGGASAHLALLSSLRLVTRVNALRFCLSRLGPPPRVVVSGASHAPRVSAVCGIRICSSGTRWMGALPALRLISPCRPFSSFSDGTSVLCSCSSRPAVVPAFAAAILQQRRSTFCAPAHLDWRTVPRGRCRRGVIHRLVVVAVAGVSQGFRGRHWSAARSTGGTELGGYTGGQYSLRKVVHPEGSSGPDKLRHLVPGRGVEPLRPHGQRILSAPRLPFRHPGQLAHCGTKLASEHIMPMKCSHAVSREGDWLPVVPLRYSLRALPA